MMRNLALFFINPVKRLYEWTKEGGCSDTTLCLLIPIFFFVFVSGIGLSLAGLLNFFGYKIPLGSILVTYFFAKASIILLILIIVNSVITIVLLYFIPELVSPYVRILLLQVPVAVGLSVCTLVYTYLIPSDLLETRASRDHSKTNASLGRAKSVSEEIAASNTDNYEAVTKNERCLQELKNMDARIALADTQREDVLKKYNDQSKRLAAVEKSLRDSYGKISRCEAFMDENVSLRKQCTRHVDDIIRYLEQSSFYHDNDTIDGMYEAFDRMQCGKFAAFGCPVVAEAIHADSLLESYRIDEQRREEL